MKKRVLSAILLSIFFYTAIPYGYSAELPCDPSPAYQDLFRKQEVWEREWEISAAEIKRIQIQYKEVVKNKTPSSNEYWLQTKEIEKLKTRVRNLVIEEFEKRGETVENFKPHSVFENLSKKTFFKKLPESERAFIELEFSEDIRNGNPIPLEKISAWIETHQKSLPVINLMKKQIAPLLEDVFSEIQSVWKNSVILLPEGKLGVTLEKAKKGLNLESISVDVNQILEGEVNGRALKGPSGGLVRVDANTLLDSHQRYVLFHELGHHHWDVELTRGGKQIFHGQMKLNPKYRETGSIVTPLRDSTPDYFYRDFMSFEEADVWVTKNLQFNAFRLKKDLIQNWKSFTTEVSLNDPIFRSKQAQFALRRRIDYELDLRLSLKPSGLGRETDQQVEKYWAEFLKNKNPNTDSNFNFNKQLVGSIHIHKNWTEASKEALHALKQDSAQSWLKNLQLETYPVSVTRSGNKMTAEVLDIDIPLRGYVFDLRLNQWKEGLFEDVGSYRLQLTDPKDIVVLKKRDESALQFLQAEVQRRYEFAVRMHQLLDRDLTGVGGTHERMIEAIRKTTEASQRVKNAYREGLSNAVRESRPSASKRH